MAELDTSAMWGVKPSTLLMLWVRSNGLAEFPFSGDEKPVVKGFSRLDFPPPPLAVVGLESGRVQGDWHGGSGAVPPPVGFVPWEAPDV